MTRPSEEPDSGARHFSCTGCGKCCDTGPEMELSEATALAGRFITSVIFKLHSLPINERSRHAEVWWKGEGSRIPLRAALEEKRRHLAAFASWKMIDKPRERALYLTISAMVNDVGTNDDGEARCPALEGDRCGIYDERSLTCRTVPLHYSRPLSVLNHYLDEFTGHPDYRCDTGPDAPVILEKRSIVSPAIQQAREDALRLAKAERGWKDHIIRQMENAEAAGATGLPTHDAVRRNSDHGYATTLPMIVAWRAAKAQGAITANMFEQVCRQQLSLIRIQVARASTAASIKEWLDLQTVYEFELSSLRRPAMVRSPLFVGDGRS